MQMEKTLREARTSAEMLVFVYGTLRRGQGFMADCLERAGRHLGRAIALGASLYDLGPYPGMVEDDRPNRRTVGEVCDISGPGAEEIMQALDRYEGTGPGGCAGLYERKRIEVVALYGPCNKSVMAHAYFYRGYRKPVGRWIESGDWLNLHEVAERAARERAGKP